MAGVFWKRQNVAIRQCVVSLLQHLSAAVQLSWPEVQKLPHLLKLWGICALIWQFHLFPCKPELCFHFLPIYLSLSNCLTSPFLARAHSGVCKDKEKLKRRWSERTSTPATLGWWNKPPRFGASASESAAPVFERGHTGHTLPSLWLRGLKHLLLCGMVKQPYLACRCTWQAQ